MVLYAIFVHWKKDDTTEVMEVMDDAGYDNNSGWLHAHLEKHKRDGDFTNAAIFEISLPAGTEDTIRRALLHTSDTIEAMSVKELK